MRTDEMLEKYDVRVTVTGHGLSMDVKRRNVDEDFHELHVTESMPMIKGAGIDDIAVFWVHEEDDDGIGHFVYVGHMYGGDYIREAAQKLYDVEGDDVFSLGNDFDIAFINKYAGDYAFNTFLSITDVFIEWLDKNNKWEA